MSSPGRVLAILDLFTIERAVWSADDIAHALSYSRPTAYRYVKELIASGFLRRAGGGSYSLGARIIELDYQIRRSDPVLLAAVPVMDALAASSGFDLVLSALYAERLIDIHRSSLAGERLRLAYGRGRLRPLFLGAAGKILVANLPRAQQVRLYARRHADATKAGLGDDWDSFHHRLATIRKAGYYQSLGELESTLGAAAVDVSDHEGECVAALAIVAPIARVRELDEALLCGLLKDAALRIEDALRP